jgi:hypothetical protein
MRSADHFDVPLDLTDVLTVCREFSRLGYNIQAQIELLIDHGVENAINQQLIKRSSLPYIRSFLRTIVDAQYFGEAGSKADDLITEIDFFIHRNPYQPTAN